MLHVRRNNRASREVTEEMMPEIRKNLTCVLSTFYISTIDFVILDNGTKISLDITFKS